MSRRVLLVAQSEKALVCNSLNHLGILLGTSRSGTCCGTRLIFRVFSVIPPPPVDYPPGRSWSCCYQCIHRIRLLRVSRQCTQFTSLKYLPRSCLLAEVNKQVFAITLLNRNLDHTAQLSIS